MRLVGANLNEMRTPSRDGRCARRRAVESTRRDLIWPTNPKRLRRSETGRVDVDVAAPPIGGGRKKCPGVNFSLGVVIRRARTARAACVTRLLISRLPVFDCVRETGERVAHSSIVSKSRVNILEFCFVA